MRPPFAKSAASGRGSRRGRFYPMWHTTICATPSPPAGHGGAFPGDDRQAPRHMSECNHTALRHLMDSPCARGSTRWASILSPRRALCRCRSGMSRAAEVGLSLRVIFHRNYRAGKRVWRMVLSIRQACPDLASFGTNNPAPARQAQNCVPQATPFSKMNAENQAVHRVPVIAWGRAVFAPGGRSRSRSSSNCARPRGQSRS